MNRIDEKLSRFSKWQDRIVKYTKNWLFFGKFSTYIILATIRSEF